MTQVMGLLNDVNVILKNERETFEHTSRIFNFAVCCKLEALTFSSQNTLKVQIKPASEPSIKSTVSDHFIACILCVKKG